MNWAKAVQQLVRDRSAGELELSQICVALVTGGTQPSAVGTDHVINPRFGGDRCIENDPSGDTGKRVQVSVARPAKIEALFLKIPLDLNASATSRFEV